MPSLQSVQFINIAVLLNREGDFAMIAKRSGFAATVGLVLIFIGSSFLLFGQSPGPHSPDGAQGRLKTPPMRVVSPHELSISFPARLPYGRQAEIASIALTADGVTLKPAQHVLYDVLIPDFVTDAEVVRTNLVFDADQGVVVNFNHLEASPASCAVCSELKLAKAPMQTVRSVSLTASAEVVIDIEAGTQSARVFGKTNANVKR